jgi:pyruvate dehydrogenase E1 component
VHGLAMLPFYIYYSMFGFQRVGDQIWAAADQRPRGFLLGATSGRTTLGGEGLQHQDGTSHLIASTIPNCKSYDPAFAGEMAVIVDAGIREMMVEQKDVFYYITLMNENYAQPDVAEDQYGQILKGCYRFRRLPAGAAAAQVVLMGSGAILTEVLKAAEQLHAQGVSVDVYSVTSWSELARDGAACVAAALDGKPGDAAPAPFLQQQLGSFAGPVIAASDYVRAVPETVRAYLPAGARYLTLGTDGFGRSDTRAMLRGFFGVDAESIAKAARRMLDGPVCGR